MQRNNSYILPNDSQYENNTNSNLLIDQNYGDMCNNFGGIPDNRVNLLNDDFYYNSCNNSSRNIKGFDNYNYNYNYNCNNYNHNINNNSSQNLSYQVLNGFVEEYKENRELKNEYRDFVIQNDHENINYN